MDISKIEELLGDEASYLLHHTSKTVTKDQLIQPTPDYVDQVWYHSDRNNRVLGNLQWLMESGRLGGTGYLSILPVDQGIEHSAGASFANLLTVFPFLIVLSQYKIYITMFALVMIVFAGYVNYKTYHMPCPADPEIGRLCMQTRKRSRYIYYFSVGLFVFATIFTYIIPRII